MEEEIKPGYTRVTEILKPWNNFDGIPKDILEAKRQIGVKVHDAIRTYYDGFPVEPLQSDVGPYFDSFLEWQNATKGRTGRIAPETRFYDDSLMITGSPDAILRIPDRDNLVMVDWKTSASYTKKMGTTWSLQGTFYHHLLLYNEVPNVDTVFWFIQLDPHGKMPKVREFEYTTEGMTSCIAALHMHKLYNPREEK